MRENTAAEKEKIQTATDQKRQVEGKVSKSWVACVPRKKFAF